MRVAPRVTLTSQDRATLKAWAGSPSLPAHQVERARIVLLAAEGRQDLEIAAELRITNQKASRWRRRFLAAGLAGLTKDAPRSGRPREISTRQMNLVILLAAADRRRGTNEWSTRSIAEAVEISEASVRRILRASRNSVDPPTMPRT